MSLPQHASPEQADMNLPDCQDVILDVTAWANGPLPTQEHEAIALKIFARQYPMAAWADPSFCRERNDARRFALQLHCDFLKLDGWTLENAGEKLAEELQPLMFGARRIGPTLREEIRDYCDCFLADAWSHFSNRLRYTREVEANERELIAEDARS